MEATCAYAGARTEASKLRRGQIDGLFISVICQVKYQRVRKIKGGLSRAPFDVYPGSQLAVRSTAGYPWYRGSKIESCRASGTID